MWAEAAGSLRRGQETIGDIELVAATTDPASLFAAVLDAVDVVRVLHRSDRRLYVLTDGVQIGIRCPPPSQAGAALLHLTGSHAHVTQLRARAARRHWSLEPDGLIRGQGQPPLGTHEVEIYNALGAALGPRRDPDGRRGTDRGGNRDAADAHFNGRHPG